MAIAKSLTLSDFHPDNGNNSDSRKLVKTNEIIDAINSINGADIQASSIRWSKIQGDFNALDVVATGAQQDLAHGLANTPVVVMFSVVELPAGLAAGFSAVESAAADANAVHVTVSPAGAKFRLLLIA